MVRQAPLTGFALSSLLCGTNRSSSSFQTLVEALKLQLLVLHVSPFHRALKNAGQVIVVLVDWKKMDLLAGVGVLAVGPSQRLEKARVLGGRGEGYEGDIAALVSLWLARTGKTNHPGAVNEVLRIDRDAGEILVRYTARVHVLMLGTPAVGAHELSGTT